jgi:phosphonate transport system substrate-binding protein
MRTFCACLAFSAVTVFAQPAPPPTTAPAPFSVTVGVVAATNEDEAKAQSDTLARFVGQALKASVRSRVFTDQEALAVAIGKSEVDVALIGPLGYLRIDPRAKAALLFRTVRSGQKTYRSVLFGPPKGKLTSLEALKKEKKLLKVAWVETSSATGYLIPKAQLLAAGINPAQSFEVQDFLGSHDAVCKAVLEGKYDVGATFSDAGGKLTGCVAPLGKKSESLTIIALSTEVPNDVVVASPGFSKEKGLSLTAAAKVASTTADGQKTLKAALMAEGVTDVSEEDFTPVRKALESFGK